MTAIKAFREAFVGGDVQTNGFNSFDARKMRYQIYWAFYENTAYRDTLHSWAQAYKADFGLYRYVRAIYNPAYRLGQFWRNHLMGGMLDPEAGDGSGVPSALPIITKNERLRPAIAQVWRWSNWQINKDLCSLWGAVLGDVVIKINDDVERGKVYLSVVHPSSLKSVMTDAVGNVKAYVIEEERQDPTANTEKMATYTEVASRDGEDVVYETFLNGKPYAWNGEAETWAEPYGFIPMVVIQHNNVGLKWGWSEFHPAQPKFREVDDLASKLSDQVRKMVDAPWFFSGVQKPGDDRRKATATMPNSNSSMEPGREEIPTFFGPVGSDAKPLVANLDIEATMKYILSILQIIEQDYPELDHNLHSFGNDSSGMALRVARQPTETKVKQVRANYDNALVRAQQMAVAIAGLRGYDGFSGFSLASYEAGDLEHHIGGRPVFEKDPADDLLTEQLFWNVASSAKNAGVPLVLFLERNGWSKDQIKKLVESPEYQAKIAGLNAAMEMNGAAKNNPHKDEQEDDNDKQEAKNNQQE